MSCRCPVRRPADPVKSAARFLSNQSFDYFPVIKWTLRKAPSVFSPPQRAPMATPLHHPSILVSESVRAKHSGFRAYPLFSFNHTLENKRKCPHLTCDDKHALDLWLMVLQWKRELFVWLARTPSVCPNCQLVGPRCCAIRWMAATLTNWIASLPQSQACDTLPLGQRSLFLDCHSLKSISLCMAKYFVVPNEEDMWWSSWIGGLVVQLKGVIRSITSAHPPCAIVSFSPLCPPCSGSQEGGTRSRRWCAEAVGKHTEIRRINCHSGAKHTSDWKIIQHHWISECFLMIWILLVLEILLFWN